MVEFLIKYRDPESEEILSERMEFDDWSGRATQDGKPVGPPLTITAKEWAEDWAYTAADKGWYEVTECDLSDIEESE